MIDTSVRVAGLVRNHENHEFHSVARPYVVEAPRIQVPGARDRDVIAETWAALRRSPCNLDAATVTATLGPQEADGRIAATQAPARACSYPTGSCRH